MKFTKKQFKSVSALVGAISLSFAFGVGHLIASNEKIDNTPVITVPIQKPYSVLSPTTVSVSGDNVNVVYLFTGNITLSSNYSCGWTNELNLFVDESSLYCRVDNTYTIDEYLNNGNSSYTFELGEYSTPTDLSVLINYSLAPVVAPNIYQTLSFYVFLTYKNETIPYQFQYRLYGLNLSSTNGNLLDDKISSGFIYFMFNNYQTLYENGVDYVLSHLDEYGLYDETQYLAYGVQQYNLGRGDAGNVLSIGELVREIFRAPISMFSNAFNFVLPLPDGQTLNVGGILTFFLTIGIALTIVNLIMKIGGK